MNFSMVFYIIGWILEFESAFLILPALCGVIYGEFTPALAFLSTALFTFAVGCILKRKKPKHRDLYAREGFVTVALGWLAMSTFGAVPFMITGEIPHFVDALFETVSGFTTTGASILTDVEALSHASLFWRSFTHWIGGMGVFVFIMAILPLMGGSTMNLMRAESPGPSVGKLLPRVQDTAKILYALYIGITLLCTVSLLFCGMNLFESLTMTFGTVGTGGFGVYNSSAAAFSPAAQNVLTLFMILSGINYTSYFLLLRKQFKAAITMEEVMLYLLIILGSVSVITWDIHKMYPSVSESLRHSFFQVGSIITTTGFATTDFNLWPQLSKTILVILMFIGACSGSTGGGIKISRVLILAKSIRNELSLMIHPRMVRKIKMDGRSLSNETLRSTNVYIAVYFIIMLASILLISVDGFDFTTNFTAVAATLNNIGPGLEMVGPTQNFSIYSLFSKCILIFNMLAGRLELFPMLILLVPACWKKH
ncbi:MAG: TrkH family potassium uptake protein [Lachnospiraceae bacterium]|nr:TrkH family potassium uptake protein [Lachnospiraceae bacterium]